MGSDHRLQRDPFPGGGARAHGCERDLPRGGPEYPGIVAAPGSPEGTGSTLIVYGLRPGAPVTVRTAGALERVFSGNVDAYGVYVKYLGMEWPVGQYRVTVEVEGRQLHVTATR